MTLTAVLILACTGPSAPPEPPVLGASTHCFESLADTLASDAMEGRGVGTPGLERAEGFLGRAFERLGLESPLPGHRQVFQATTGVALGRENALSWQLAEGERREGRLQDDFIPLGMSSTGEFSAGVVFAGYGIRAPSLGYDDYAGVDVQGKVVLAFRYEPGEEDPKSPFSGRRPSHHSDLRSKALQAREAGAVALILVSPPRDDENRLPALRSSGPVSRAGIPVLQVSRKLADEWLAASGLAMAALQSQIDASYSPASSQLSGLHVEGRIHVEAKVARAANLVGVHRGRGDLEDQTVVVGAHYDHLGLGGHGSLAPGAQAIHNGADDNASGVAALLCGVGGLLQRLEERSRPRRSLVVVAFSAEEIGVGGSSWYVKHPVMPLAKTVAMVNLDMVGRLRNSKLLALGTDSSSAWPALLGALAESQGLSLQSGGDGFGPSDQLPFYQDGIPVVHLFTGAHPEYHTPRDRVETLNLEGGGRVAAFLETLLLELLERTEELEFQRSTGSSPLFGDSRGFGSYLGTVPDYSEMGSPISDGVLLADVRPGGPADRAGLQGGDRLIRMAGVEIRNLHDLTFVLRDHRPGEVVEIEFLRDGRSHHTSATLGRRGS